MRSAILLVVGVLVSFSCAEAGQDPPDAPTLTRAAAEASHRGVIGVALHPAFAENRRVYVLWTEQARDVEALDVFAPPLLAQRVDRFVWNGSELVFEHNVLRFQAFDELRPAVADSAMRFGADGKLYVRVGTVGSRGWRQNLPSGPLAGDPDVLGRAALDDADGSPLVIRLNDDGSAPADNPFFAAGARLGGAVGANLQRLYPADRP
jgi:glucose/arabinose dehydrogenase